MILQSLSISLSFPLYFLLERKQKNGKGRKQKGARALRDGGDFAGGGIRKRNER